MRAVGIWVIALVFYGAFLLWYDSWDGPLAAAEIEEYTKRLEARAGALDAERRAALRAFLEEDDRGEVFMLNLDDWGVEPDPGRTLAGVIRYRSRRDMMEMATDSSPSAVEPGRGAGSSASRSWESC